VTVTKGLSDEFLRGYKSISQKQSLSMERVSVPEVVAEPLRSFLDTLRALVQVSVTFQDLSLRRFAQQGGQKNGLFGSITKGAVFFCPQPAHTYSVTHSPPRSFFTCS
jgi:hypothetical protein